MKFEQGKWYRSGLQIHQATISHKAAVRDSSVWEELPDGFRLWRQEPGAQTEVVAVEQLLVGKLAHLKGRPDGTKYLVTGVEVDGTIHAVDRFGQAFTYKFEPGKLDFIDEEVEMSGFKAGDKVQLEG